MITTSPRTFEFGYSTKYAPSTAAIAPLAPRFGTRPSAALPTSECHRRLRRRRDEPAGK